MEGKSTHHTTHWTVSLNNGETLYEEKGDYRILAGEPSPWQRLQLYLLEKKLYITSLSIYTENGKRFNLPSAGKNPRFSAFKNTESPVSYTWFRNYGQEQGGLNAGREDHYATIEATYSDGRKLQIWVDDITNDSWSVIV